jgi:protein gp37
VGQTSIEWTEQTWNPVTGCSKVSPGCAHCYAEAVAERFWAKRYLPVLRARDWNVQPPRDIFTPREFTDVQCHPERLDEPLRWRKPRRVFVNSMSDLFHEAVPDRFIAAVFGVMAAAPQHTYQVLTKRPARMRAWFDWIAPQDPEPWTEAHWQALALDESGVIHQRSGGDSNRPWPLPNVWVGVSVENQHFAGERIPLLLETPAAMRFVSYEPALGAVNFRQIDIGDGLIDALGGTIGVEGRGRAACERLDWLIVGGESGTKARPCKVEWVRSAVRQCREAGVACFVKQLGANPVTNGDPSHADPRLRGTLPLDLRHPKGADITEWFADLRVRDWPTVLESSNQVGVHAS